MNHIFLQNHHHGEALIVIFLGWGVPAEAFTDLKKISATYCCLVATVQDARPKRSGLLPENSLRGIIRR